MSVTHYGAEKRVVSKGPKGGSTGSWPGATADIVGRALSNTKMRLWDFEINFQDEVPCIVFSENILPPTYFQWLRQANVQQ